MQGYRIQDRFEFWMPCCAFRIPGTGIPDSLSTMELEFPFSIVSRNPGSFSCTSDSKSQDYGFLITLREAMAIDGYNLNWFLAESDFRMMLKWKRANKTEVTYRAIWLVNRTDTNARGFWLVERTLGWKKFMPENFLEINRYFALTSYCNTIGQSNNAFSILGFSLAGKRRGHVLIFSSTGW